MITMTNRLASGKMARLSLGAVAATALTAASITPAAADDRRDRDGISAGEVIAGAVVIGGIAALALGIAMGGELAGWPLRAIRLVLAAVLAVTAIWVALSVRGVIG